MSKQDLYKQAIADAKQLKDITMEAAKQQIAEAFTPKIQEMFRLKVNELEEEYDDDTTSGDMEESIGIMDEATLDEILAELTAEEGKEKMKEDNLEEGLDSHDMEEAKKDDEDEDKAEMKAGDEAEEESQEVAELSVEEFKKLVRDVVADVLANNAGEEAGEEGLDDLDAMAGDGEDSISLDEILAELQEEEAIEEAKKMMDGHHKEDHMHKMKEAKKMMDGHHKEDHMHKMKEAMKMKKSHHEEEEDMHKMEEELYKANATIQELRSSINELNLFNAKLLYTSKIFESKNLSSSQKAKVLNAFDRANTVKEVKNTYSVLNENFIAPEKNQIKESIGFASKPMGNAPGKLIVESDSIRTRMQQLAGILKPNI